jgi:hypothetical protein
LRGNEKKILKNVLLTIFMMVFSAIVKVALQTYGSLLSSIIGVLVFLALYFRYVWKILKRLFLNIIMA